MTGIADPARTLTTTNTAPKAVGLLFTGIKTIKNDRLYLNYEPVVTNTFYTNSYSFALFLTHTFTGNYSYFGFKLHFPQVSSTAIIPQDYNLQTVSFTRKNIG